MKLWQWFTSSVLFKMWLVMVLLVVVLSVAVGVGQQFYLSRVYLAQQEQRLIEEAEKLAAVVAVGDRQELQRHLRWFAEVWGGYIFVILPSGEIGFRVGFEHKAGSSNRPMWSGGPRMGMMGAPPLPLSSSEVEQVMRGNTIARWHRNLATDWDVLTVAVPIRNEDRVNGVLVISVPQAPIRMSLRVLQSSMLLVLLGGGLLASLLSVVVSRYLVGRLQSMRRLAQEMAAGNYRQRIPEEPPDELGQLAHSLNILSATIEEKIAALERIDRTRREFVANVSHELRTPLTIIQGYTEAILDGMAGSKEEEKKYLTFVLNEVGRLRRLVDDLLDLNRMQSGRLELRKQELDLVSLCQRVSAGFIPLAAEKGVVLEFKEPVSPVLLVNADSDRLQQVLVNLLDNALRFVPVGGYVRVNIYTDDKHAVVEVEDNGPGIPPADLPFIWERFYKVDPARTRTGSEGSGLGLAIVRAIVEAHGGEIFAANREEGGARFVVRLPLAGMSSSRRGQAERS